MKSFFMGHLRIALVFAILTIAPLISESLLGNNPVTMAILQKCLGTISSKTSTISLTLTFRCVSRKFITLLMSPPIPKMITDAVYLISRCCVRRI